MGLGKTVITLTAIHDLIFDSFEVQKVLIIAPLRVARTTWAAECRKWEHLRPLRLSVAVGTEAERRAALQEQAEVYVINREQVDWLVNGSRLPFDFDMVVIDELSSFKSHQSKRFRALMKVRKKIQRMVGLTWSLELYQQTNARLWRQGQTADTVVIQHIVTAGTMDDHVLTALQQKEQTQNSLMGAVRAELGGIP